MKLSFEWLQSLVPSKLSAEKLGESLTLAGLEVKKVETSSHGDQAMEIEITSNRPDWLSHIGVAREISAIENISCKALPAIPAYQVKKDNTWTLKLENKEGCPYYTGVYIQGIKNTETPQWMKKRLQTCGMRSISFLVDVTNYILLLTGQPLHAFDANFLSDRQIVIRNAKSGEKFSSLKGDEVTLQEKDLVIADSKHTVALAGVIGGKNSEIIDSTQNIFLESAFFDPRRVRRTALRTGIRTDSSYRFERRVDPESVDLARDLALALILEFAQPESVSQIFRLGTKPKLKIKPVTLTNTEILESLGMEIPITRASQILNRLGIPTRALKHSLVSKIPSFRADLERPIDLVEEIARIYGFDKIPEVLPETKPLPLVTAFDDQFSKIEETRDYFVHHGYYETNTFSLVSNPGDNAPGSSWKPVIIVNPQNKELNQMRRTLLPSLLGVLKLNLNQQAENLLFFEVANIYREENGNPLEEKVLAVICSGNLRSKNWSENAKAVSFYDLKGILLDWACRLLPGQCRLGFANAPVPGLDAQISQRIFFNNEDIGFAGQVTNEVLKKFDLDQDVFYAEIRILDLLKVKNLSPRFQELPKFPSISRDLAISVPENTKAGEIEHLIRREAGALAVQIELFDLFRGGRIPKGFKNLAFRVVYQSPDRTLLSDEIQTLHNQVAKKIQDRFNATFQ